MPNTPTTLLIDADLLVYQAAFGAERAIEWDEGEFTYHANLEDGIAAFKSKLGEILEAFPRGVPILCLSDSSTCYRRDFWPTYKAGRNRRPLLYSALREWVLGAEWRTYLKPRLEADDILGILATHPKLVPGRKVMVSIDKDLKQIPGELYNPGTQELTETSEEEGEDLFLTQTLTGDPTDNYPGCPGIGPVKAAKIVPGGWEAVVAAYLKAGLTEADALIQARCARILRAEDYDFKKGEPKLWNP